MYETLRFFRVKAFKKWLLSTLLFMLEYDKVENNWNLTTATMLLWKWDVSEDLIGAVLTAVLKTPGLIMVEYWHQVIFDLNEYADQNVIIRFAFGSKMKTSARSRRRAD